MIQSLSLTKHDLVWSIGEGTQQLVAPLPRLILWPIPCYVILRQEGIHRTMTGLWQVGHRTSGQSRNCVYLSDGNIVLYKMIV